jgi:hypothetical protein
MMILQLANVKKLSFIPLLMLKFMKSLKSKKTGFVLVREHKITILETPILRF